MPYKIILAPEAVEDLKALRAFERATVRDTMKEHLRFEPTKTSKVASSVSKGCVTPSIGCVSMRFAPSMM